MVVASASELNFRVTMLKGGAYVQPISPCPPKREQKEYGKDDCRDFTRIRVESTCYQTSSNKRRAQVTRRKG